MITEPGDAIIRVTSTTICGSDLHLYHHEFAGMEKGDIIGHEAMGIVTNVGENVKNLQKGDRVVISAVIACGQCYYCNLKRFSCCDITNPSKEMEALYGHRTGALFGYSHLLGGYEGCQAEYVRVPFADVNCLKVPSHLPDEKVLFLSDIVCTAWHACELGEVSAGQTVAIWGMGPVGLLTVMWAKFRGASRVIAIDAIPNRLELARTQGVEIIDFSKDDPIKKIQEICPGGPDVCIDCVGFRFPKSLIHKVERMLRLETDAPDVLTECITCCKKSGVVSIVGDYISKANGFPIGAMMEKGLTMRGGQVFVQKYWKELLGYIEQGKVDPTFVITHTMPITQTAEAYRMFDRKEDGAIKIILKPRTITESL
jgi:threonine dehydrogenase-like Zn-dependent dehydrogenase